MLIIGHPAPLTGRHIDHLRVNAVWHQDQERTGNGEEKSRRQAHHHPSVSHAPQAERIWTRYNAPGGLFPPDLTLVFPCHYTNRF